MKVMRTAVFAGVLAVGLVAGTASAQPRLDPGPVEVIATFDGGAGELVEGVEADRDGNLYVSMPLTGEIRRIAPDGTETTIATLPAGTIDENGIGPLGLESDQHGRLYAAVATFDSDTGGVYRIDPDGTVVRLPGTGAIPWPNGLDITRDGTVYVSDSTGAVWRISPRGAAVEWVRSPLLEGDGSLGFGFEIGANGIVTHGRAVFVTNLEKGRIFRIPLLPGGSAGPVELLAEDQAFVGADGMVADVFGNLYVAVLAQSTILRLSTHGVIETVATADDGVDGVSSLAFGHGRNRSTLYFVNFFPAAGPSLLGSRDIGVPGAP